MNTIYIVQGLDRTDNNTEWESLLIDDTWAGLQGRFSRLEHKSNWQEFRLVVTQINR